MTREEYIKIRNKGAANYIYDWYVEHFDEKKHEFLLEIEEFFHFFQFWPKSQEVYNIMTAYWDAHFNVLKVPNKQGQYFMYI